MFALQVLFTPDTSDGYLLTAAALAPLLLGDDAPAHLQSRGQNSTKSIKPNRAVWKSAGLLVLLFLAGVLPLSILVSHLAVQPS